MCVSHDCEPYRMAEPTDLPFGETRVSPNNHVLYEDLHPRVMDNLGDMCRPTAQ